MEDQCGYHQESSDLHQHLPKSQSYWPNTISNVELWQKTNQLPVAEEKSRWRWIGHTLRKPILCTKGKRKRGRPRNTWRRELEADTRRMGCTWQELVRRRRSSREMSGVSLWMACAPGGVISRAVCQMNRSTLFRKTWLVKLSKIELNQRAIFNIINTDSLEFFTKNTKKTNFGETFSHPI